MEAGVHGCVPCPDIYANCLLASTEPSPERIRLSQNKGLADVYLPLPGCPPAAARCPEIAAVSLDASVPVLRRAETTSPPRPFCGVFSRLPGRAAKSRKSTSPQQDPCCPGRAPALSVHHTEVTQLINRTACRPGTTEGGLRPYPGSLQTGTGTLWTAGAKDGTPPLPTWLRRVPTRTAPPPTPFSPCGNTRASGRPGTGGASPPPSSAMAPSALPAVAVGTASTRHVRLPT